MRKFLSVISLFLLLIQNTYIGILNTYAASSIDIWLLAIYNSAWISSLSYNPWDWFSLNIQATNNVWVDIKNLYSNFNFSNNADFSYNWTNFKSFINFQTSINPIPASAYNSTTGFSYELTTPAFPILANTKKAILSYATATATGFLINPNISTYQNSITANFNWLSNVDSSSITWLSKSTNFYVNVKPHITDYYFSKSSIVWNGVDSTDLTVKVKDYNWCANIDGWVITANLGSLWLSITENLIYNSCDVDWKTAIFNKVWITTLSDVWDKTLAYTDFYAKDEDNNITDPNDANTSFDDEDKKINLILTVASSSAPVVTISSINPNIVSNQSATTTFSATQTWTYKVVINWDGTCSNWTIITDWSNYDWSSINSNILASNLNEWNNTIYVCVKNTAWDIGSANINITKDNTAPIISSTIVSPSSVTTADSSIWFTCNENWQYRFTINAFDSWYQSAISWVWNNWIILNSNINIWANTITLYCKDTAWNETTWTTVVTKVLPTPAMTSSWMTLTDNDIWWDWVDWRDLKVTWDSSVATSFAWFESYRIYVLPENTAFSTWYTVLWSVANRNTTTWTWANNITNDSAWNPLAWWSYVTYVAIMWTSWELWTPASATWSLVADVVPHPSVLSAKFTSTQNLQVKFDADLKTDLSIHNATWFVFQVSWTTYTWTSISSVSNDTINVTISDLINTASTWTLDVFTWAAWWVPVDGSYNNATWWVLITDGTAPIISNFATWSTAYYQNYYSWILNFNYTVSETLKAWGSTSIQFTRIWWNVDTVKTYYITNTANLTSWSHTESVNLATLWLVSWTTYEARLIASDLLGNTTTSSPVTIIFDNAWPNIVNINPFGLQRVLGILNPTFTWLSSTDDYWNGSWVKWYKLRVYTWDTTYTSWKTCDWAYNEYNITNLADLSSQTTLANLYNYAWSVTAYDNMENIWTVSTCDNFYINNLVPSFSNNSITDTVINSTSYTKWWNNLVVKSTITNSSSDNIWLNASTIKDSTYANISCASPVSGVTCTYSANIATYTFSAWADAALSSWVKQVQFTAANSSGINTWTTLTSITLDNTIPSVAGDTLTAPISWTIGWTSTNITWTPSKVTDNIWVSYVKLEYSSDWGSNWNLISTWANSWSYPWDITSLSSGANYKVKISAYDLVWQSNNQIWWIFAIDKVAPIVPSTSITYPSDAWIKLKWGINVNITWNAWWISDNIGLAANPITLYYSTDWWTNYTQIATNEANDWTYAWAVPSVNNTTVKIKLEASDNVGNKSFDISDNNFEIDSTSPVLTVTYAWLGWNTPQTNKYINNSWIDLTATISDTNLSGWSASYSFYNQTTNTYWNWTSYIGTEVYNSLTTINATSYNLLNTITPSITNWDTYKLKIRSTDIVDNSYTTAQITYFWDTVNPNIWFTNWSTVYSSGNLLIAWNSSDASSGVWSVKLEITDWSNYFDWTSFQASLTQLATTTSDSYANWNYDFTIPWIVADWTSINVKSIAYDKAYKTPNVWSGNITVIKDTTWPVISTWVITYPAGWESFRWGRNITITWNTAAISDAVSWIAANSIDLEYYDWTNWMPLATWIANSGSYNWNIATIDYNNARIRITAKDNVWISTSQVSQWFLVDSLPPQVTSLQTIDNDANWQVDWLLVWFSEFIKDNSINTSKFSISDWISITSTGTAWTTDDDSIALYFTNTWASNFTPTLTYTSWAVADFVWNELVPWSIISIDKVVPRVQSVQIFDTNSNWKLDKIEVTMSEALAASSVNNWWTIDNAYNWMSIASVSTSSNKINLILTESSAFNTSTGNLVLSLNNSTYIDLAWNLAWNMTSTPIDDKASPVLLSSSTSDNNSNYKVDKVNLLFSENIATINPSDLSLSYLSTWSTVSSITWTGTSTLSLNLSETSLDNDTSYKPNIIYSWSSLNDSSNNTTANFNNTVTDWVSPKIISKETYDSNNNGKADNVKITFSENVNWDISSTVIWVNSYNVSSYATWANYIIANVDEKDAIDTSLLLDSKILSNTSLKDNDWNLVLAEASFTTSTDKMWPVISFARFDWVDKLYLSFSENVTNASLIASNFILNWSSASIIWVNFTTGTNSAILTISSTDITYWTSTISFAINTATDLAWNIQSNQIFARISPSVVINEVMYSDIQANQYIELRNMWNTSVSLSGWVLQNAANSGTNNLTLPSWATIWANWYYLIANSSSAASILSWAITPDFVTSSLSLNNITQSNIILSDDIWTNYDSAISSPWPAWNSNQDISMERKNIPWNWTVGTNWYSAVASIWFDDTTPKWTPGTDNKIDVTPPVIWSFTPTENTLFPIWDNINLTYNYSDDIAWISTGTSNIVIQKYNWATFDTLTGQIASSTIDTTATNYILNHLDFGKYKATFTIDDKAGNTVTQIINFYVDKVEFVVSTWSIDIGSVKSNIWKYAIVEESITVKTLWAWFTLYNWKSTALTKWLTDIPDYSWSTNYWFGFDLYKNEVWVITDYSSIINPVNNTIVWNSAKDVSSSDWTQKTYFYKLKYYVRVQDEQDAWNYTTNADFSLILNY